MASASKNGNGIKDAVKNKLRGEIRWREDEIALKTSDLIRGDKEVDKMASFGNASGDHAATNASFVPDYAAGHLDHLRSEIFLLEQAIERVDADTYGICLGCGEAISLKRFITVPWASHCAPCLGAKEVEQKRKSFRNFNPARHHYALVRI